MYFKYNENKIYYNKYGNSKNILLILPGWGDNRKTFNNIINKLKSNYTIYIFDYPGFGNSEIPNNTLDIYEYCKIIISFMENLKIKNPIVIGHSFGGRLIITMNGFFNIKFKKIILISSAGIKKTKSKKQLFKQKIYKFLKKLGNVLPQKLKLIYQNKLICVFGSSDYKNIPQSLRQTFLNIVNEDLTKYLPNINGKTLMIWGENDLDTPIEDGYKMNKLITNSELFVLKNASHFCYLEYPEKVNCIIKEFL